MTYEKAVEQLGIEDVCFGGCGLNAYRHRGCIFLGVIHWQSRRFTRRGLRRLLLLVARRERENDPEYLNDPWLLWYHLWADEQRANALAAQLGYRFGWAYSRTERLRALVSAARRITPVSQSHPTIWAWITRGIA